MLIQKHPHLAEPQIIWRNILHTFHFETYWAVVIFYEIMAFLFLQPVLHMLTRYKMERRL